MAFAQAVSLTATVSERLTFTDNFALAGSSAGTTTSSVTNFALNFRTSTQTSILSLYAGTDLVLRRDPGGSTNTSGFNPNVRASYTRTGQTLSFDASANYSDAPINFQTAPPGTTPPPGGGAQSPLITSTANQRNFGANTGLSYQINSTNSLDGSLQYSSTEFDASATGLFDYSTSSISLGWSHDFDANLTGSVDGSYSMFTTDAPGGSDSQTTTLGATATWQRTNNITLNGSLSLSRTSQDAASDSTGVFGNVGLDYALPTGNLGVSLGRSLAAGSGGSLLESTSLGVVGTYDINSTSRLAFDVGYVRDNAVSGGASTSVLTVTPSYALDLTSSVTASASYTLKNSDTGTSHGISLNLVKNFDLLP